MTKCALLFVLLCPALAAAQDRSPDARAESASTDPGSSIRKGAWDFGLIASGGNGLGFAANTQFASAGGRLGLVLTKEHGTGWRRGNFEWAIEILPLYAVRTPRGAVYGGSIVPAMWRWNFTSSRTIAPFASVGGGILFSTHNLPPGNTSAVNFTPQLAMGVNFFVKPKGAFLFEGAYVHHSNAGLGTDNPGYNAALFVSVGYTWFGRQE